MGQRVIRRTVALLAIAWVLMAHVAMGQTGADPVSSRSEMVPRPDPDGTPTSVSLGLFFLDVAQIDDVAQEFAADVLVQAVWTDPRLADPEAPPTRVSVLPRSGILKWGFSIGAPLT